MSKSRPPHHTRTAPREWFDLFLAHGGWWVMACAGALLLLTGFAMFHSMSADRLEREGIEATAKIISKHVDRSDDDDTYHLKLRMAVERGVYTGERKVPRREYNAATIGGEVTVRYLKDKPSGFEYPVGSTRSHATMLRLVALVAGVVGLVLLWWRGSQTNAAVKARRHGQLQHATVTGFKEHEDSGTPTGRGYMIWKLDDGTRGESLTHDIRVLRRIGVGGKINVYVRDNTSVWEGDVGPRAERISPIPKVRS